MPKIRVDGFVQVGSGRQAFRADLDAATAEKIHEGVDPSHLAQRLAARIAEGSDEAIRARTKPAEPPPKPKAETGTKPTEDGKPKGKGKGGKQG